MSIASKQNVNWGSTRRRRGLQSRTLAAMGLAALCVALYGLNWRSTLVGDSQAHLFQAASLAETGDFRLDEYRGMLLKNNGGGLPYFVIESQGHLRSIFNYFPAVLLAPLFKACGLLMGDAFRQSPAMWALAGKAAATLLALGSGLLLAWLLAGWVSRGVLLAALLAFWFGSPLWPTSIDFLQHQPAIFFKLAALYLLFGRGAAKAGAHYFLGGLMLGCSVVCRYQTVPGAAVLAGFALWGLRGDHKKAWLFVAGGALLIPPTLLYHRLAFGSALASGPNPYLAFNYPALKGVIALLANPSKGLLVHSPWALAGFACPWWLWKNGKAAPERRRFVSAIAVSALPSLILYAKLNGWFGGWSWGYRYLMDILPEVVILFALMTQAFFWQARLGRSIVKDLVKIAIFVQAVGALGYDHQWHQIHDLGVGPSQHWLWQVKNSQIPFTFRRGRVYLGAAPRQLWRNPYLTTGLYDVERWDGKPFVWTERQASFLYVAHNGQPVLKVFAPDLSERGKTPFHLRIEVAGMQTRSFELSPGTWRDVPMPVAFQHSALVEVAVTRTQQEKAGGRELGVALAAEDIAITRGK